LVVTTVVGTLALFVTNAVLTLFFGLNCGSDTGSPAPGSDLEAYCDLREERPGLLVLMIFGPPLVALVPGLVAARRRQAGRVLWAILAGLAVTIAVQLPGWLLPG
jgi:hypothetical protein